MHDEIKRFSLEGELGNANVVEMKDRQVHFIESMMRDMGFVPALDLEPQFTRSFNSSTETWEFQVSVYGIHVGREKSCKASSSAEQIAGVMGGKTIMRSTPKAK